MEKSSKFLGTYFERDAVLRLERWVRWTAWAALVLYVLDTGYSVFQQVYNSIIGGFPLDLYFFINSASRVVQGVVLFMLLHVAAKALLILMDIEDNTRRAARINTK